MSFHIVYERVLPERKPPGHTPAAPRYTVRWDRPIAHLVSVYHGMQTTRPAIEQQVAFLEMIEGSFNIVDGPIAHERMRFLDQQQETNTVVVSYWLDATSHARWERAWTLRKWFDSVERLSGPVGLWREVLISPYDRHETIFSSSNYTAGLARTLGATVRPMTTNGYFGAARDRIPVSAIDALDTPYSLESLRERPNLVSRGRRLFARAPHNMTALRSGQFWEGAVGEQLEDYHETLQPRLSKGMAFLAHNKEESGTLALREMTNLNDDGSERAETSVLAYFLSLEAMENWAKSHPTHLAIYGHAIAMNRKFKEDRSVITWHEAFVLPGESVLFEYVNCHSQTGLLPFAVLFEQSE